MRAQSAMVVRTKTRARGFLQVSADADGVPVDHQLSEPSSRTKVVVISTENVPLPIPISTESMLPVADQGK